jgi:hypothetical protein
MAFLQIMNLDFDVRYKYQLFILILSRTRLDGAKPARCRAINAASQAAMKLAAAKAGIEALPSISTMSLAADIRAHVGQGLAIPGMWGWNEFLKMHL